MFKKENRLTKDKDFDNVFKNGKSSYGKLAGIKTIKNDLNFSRVGILVSTKVSKKAYQRNKIKRRIREIFKEIIKDVKTNQDIVVIVLPQAIEKDFNDLRADICRSAKKLKLIS